jgi:hypothetical protein
MAKINFPSNPTLGQTHIENGLEWIWTSAGVWDFVCEVVVLPSSSYVGIDPIVVSIDVTGSVTNVTISHTESGVTPGTYNSVTVDEYGHVTTGSVIPTPIYGVGELLFGDENGIPTSSANIYYSTQSGVIQITGSVDISGGITTSLQEGYVWVGNNDGRNVEVSTASILEPYTLLSNFNTYTESTDNRLYSIESKTGSYATTGSNIFEGNQTINGNLNVTGSFTASLQEGYVWVGDENGVNTQISTSSLFNQNNYVRVLTIPPTYIDFAQPIKPQIVNYINNIGTYDTLTHGHLIIEETDSKWNIVIYYNPVNELSSTTEINIWFDNSGSMNGTLPSLVSMVVSCLKELLLPIYGDESTYNQRVKIRTFNGYGNIPLPYQPYIETGSIGTERTFNALSITGSSDTITQVINLVFQDEAQGVYYNSTFNPNTSATGTVYTTYTNDITKLRNTLNNINNTSYYKGVVYQINETQTASNYKGFLQAVSGSTYPSYSGNFGLEDKIESGSIVFQYDITAESTSNYYLSLIRNTLISFGYTNVGNLPSIPCEDLLYGVISEGCIDYSGANGSIDVVNVIGGSGTGYYFTVNGSGSYTTGNGNGVTGLSNGTYTVVLYDNGGNIANLGDITINCQPITGSIVVSCDGTDGFSGSIDVINPTGGDGGPYVFKLNGSGSYTTGNGNGPNNIVDGTYSITLYDVSNNSVVIGDAVVNCYVAPPNYIINVYECGSCTQIDTGIIAPFGNLGSLTGLYVTLTSGDVGLITGGTSTNSPDYFIVGETTSLDCASACIS